MSTVYKLVDLRRLHKRNKNTGNRDTLITMLGGSGHISEANSVLHFIPKLAVHLITNTLCYAHSCYMSRVSTPKHTVSGVSIPVQVLQEEPSAEIQSRKLGIPQNAPKSHVFYEENSSPNI